MTGGSDTRTGTPAACSAATAASRLAGVGARGSSVRASPASSVGIDSTTPASRSAAAAPIRSRSASTRSDLVVTVNGWRHSASTSRQARVIRQRASIGW